MKHKRIYDIEKYVDNKDTVSLKELCDTFEVSMNTIRRDITYLEENGALKKVYGGVTSAKGTELTTLDFRNTKNSDAKNLIAQKAATQIKNGDLIFIDSGTTTAPIVNHLDKSLKITVITNNLLVINEASKNPNIEIIISGDYYNRKTGSFISNKSDNGYLRYYNIEKAFMATSGISLENGITNSDFSEFNIKNYIVETAAHSYILADHSKINRSGPISFSKLSSIDSIITDNPLPQTFLDYAKEKNITIM